MGHKLHATTGCLSFLPPPSGVNLVCTPVPWPLWISMAYLVATCGNYSGQMWKIWLDEADELYKLQAQLTGQTKCPRISDLRIVVG